MVNLNEVQETNRMIEEENLDVRTITMGISLLDCAHSDCSTFQRKIYDKITKKAENLVKAGEEIQKKFGVPIVNKRMPRLWIKRRLKSASILSAVFPRLCKRE